MEKIINVDLEIHKDANSNEWERYNAAVHTLSFQLLNKRVGEWGGRETALLNPKHGFINTTYWYILESGKETTKNEIERIIDNFNLSKFVRYKIGKPNNDPTMDLKDQINKKTKLSWESYLEYNTTKNDDKINDGAKYLI